MDFPVRHVSIALGDQDLSAKNDNNKKSAAGDFIVTDLQYYHCKSLQTLSQASIDSQPY